MNVDEVLAKMDALDASEEEIQYIIDENLRVISIPLLGVVLGVEGDKDVNSAKFKMVRYYKGIDLSKFDIRINFANANGDLSYYTVKNPTVTDDTLTFEWLVGYLATKYKGTVRFVVRMIITDSSTGEVQQAFDTTVGEARSLEGLLVDTPTDEKVYDLVAQLKADLTDHVNNLVEGIPADYSELTKKVDDNTSEISELKEDIADKLDKPANPVVGQVLRVKSIDETGKIVLDTTASSGSDSSQGSEIIKDIEIVETQGKFAKWVTGATSGGAESSVSWASHSQFISVTPGETLRISCMSANACPGIVFYKTNTMSTASAIGYALENLGTGDPFSGSTNRYTYIDKDVVVPNGAFYAILNNANGTTGHEWKCQKVSYISGGNTGTVESEKLEKVEYENEQLSRRLINAEKHNDFTWGTFDKAYFVFIHDDSREFITTAYNAFHAKGVPVSSAAIAPYLSNVHGGKTVKEWLDLIVADGGEVLCHYSYDLKDSDDDSLWYKYVVDAKREFERNGFKVRGMILAGSSTVNSAKGEKFCRKYFDYADKVGTSPQYNLGRKLMLAFDSLDAFKQRIDSCARTPGIYAFGFHGNRDDETWITEDSLKEIIDYISAKDNCEITTYSAVFDKIGTTVLEKRIAALENV